MKNFSMSRQPCRLNFEHIPDCISAKVEFKTTAKNGLCEMTPRDIEGGSYTQLDGETGLKPKKTYLRKQIVLSPSI